MPSEPTQVTFNPQAEMERIAANTTERGTALAELTRDDAKLASVARWYQDDPVGFSTSLAHIAEQKPRLANRIVDAFYRSVESASLGITRKEGLSAVPLGTLLVHPGGDDLLVPAGYTLDAAGTYVVDRKRGKNQISHYPLVLEGYVRDNEAGTSMVVVAWRANGEWRRMAISRESMGLSGDLARIAGSFGAPIHSSNSSQIVSYFSAFESLNLPKFEEIQGISRMGWAPAMDAFLVGTNIITADGEETIQSPATLKDNWGNAARIFLPSGPEVSGILAGYSKHGSLEQWTKALQIASPHPLVMTGLYLSLLPPLMQIVGADNLVFEWSGRSSIGKTTALTMAASVWGQPRLNREPSIVSSWRVTDVFVERLLATLGDLPCFMDDTRTAQPWKKNGVDPIQVVYDVVAGVTKGRGTILGTEVKKSWRTVLLSTGEDAITAGSTKGGVFARSWAVTAWPWGETSPSSAAKVLEMETIVADNYGLVGPFWVQRLLRQQKVWPKWREVYRSLRDEYGTKGVAGESGGITGRLGKNLAAIEMCANVARAVIPEVFGTIDFKPMIEDLWKWAQVEGSGADPAIEAAISVRNHVGANAERFYPRSKVQPKEGWWGFWPNPSAKKPFPHIYIVPDILLAYLRNNDYQPDSILSEWERMGIMKIDKKKARPRGKSKMVWARKGICMGPVSLNVIELVPPTDNDGMLDAYERLTEEDPEPLVEIPDGDE